MATTATLGKAGKTVLTGLVGVAAYDVVRRAFGGARSHRLVVTSVAWGLRGVRSAEKGAEAARLRVADIVAEARGTIGEQAPPPGVTSHGHQH